MRSKTISIFVVAAFLFSIFRPDCLVAQERSPSENARASAAVLDFQCDQDQAPEECSGLSEAFRAQVAAAGQYRVLDPGKMAEILQGKNIDLLSCPDEACAIIMGRHLGMDKVVYGSISKVHELFFVKTYILNLKFMRNENFVVRASPGPAGRLVQTLAEMAAEISRSPAYSIPPEIPAAPTAAGRSQKPKPPSSKKTWIGLVVAGLILGGAITAIAVTQSGGGEKGQGTIAYTW